MQHRRSVQIPHSPRPLGDLGCRVHWQRRRVLLVELHLSSRTQKTGWSSSFVPMLMMLAGFGMVVGGIIGGRITDRVASCRHCRSRPSISCIGLLLSSCCPANHGTTALLTFGSHSDCSSSPHCNTVDDRGRSGGEPIAGAAVQVAFNFGNAIGSIVGGAHHSP